MPTDEGSNPEPVSVTTDPSLRHVPGVIVIVAEPLLAVDGTPLHPVDSPTTTLGAEGRSSNGLPALAALVGNVAVPGVPGAVTSAYERVRSQVDRHNVTCLTVMSRFEMTTLPVLTATLPGTPGAFF